MGHIIADFYIIAARLAASCLRPNILSLRLVIKVVLYPLRARRRIVICNRDADVETDS